MDRRRGFGFLPARERREGRSDGVQDAIAPGLKAGRTGHGRGGDSGESREVLGHLGVIPMRHG